MSWEQGFPGRETHFSPTKKVETAAAFGEHAAESSPTEQDGEMGLSFWVRPCFEVGKPSTTL